MSKAKAAQKPDEIDPAAHYDVTLKKALKLGPTWLRPGQARVRLKGSVLIEHMDAVLSYELVKPRV